MCEVKNMRKVFKLSSFSFSCILPLFRYFLFISSITIHLTWMRTKQIRNWAGGKLFFFRLLPIWGSWNWLHLNVHGKYIADLPREKFFFIWKVSAQSKKDVFVSCSSWRHGNFNDFSFTSVQQPSLKHIRVNCVIFRSVFNGSDALAGWLIWLIQSTRIECSPTRKVRW